MITAGRGLNARTVTPVAALVLSVLALLAMPLCSTARLNVFDAYNVLQNVAATGLVTLGVGLTMIAGELDLSAVGQAAFAAMVAVTAGAHSPVLGIVVAVGAAGAVGAVQGLLVAKLRISSMPVTIAGFFVLAGAVGALGHDTSVQVDAGGLGLALDEPLLGLFSARSLVVLGIFAMVGLALAFTRLGRDVRAVGGDRTAARVSGVRVDGLLVGLFSTSAVTSALGGVLLAYSLGVAQASTSTAPLIFAVTAALVGGVTLSGGRGTASGILAGVTALSVLQQIFGQLASPIYVQNLVFGGLLVLAVTLDATGLRERLSGARTRARLRRTRQRESVPDRPAVASR